MNRSRSLLIAITLWAFCATGTIAAELLNAIVATVDGSPITLHELEVSELLNELLAERPLPEALEKTQAAIAKAASRRVMEVLVLADIEALSLNSKQDTSDSLSATSHQAMHHLLASPQYLGKLERMGITMQRALDWVAAKKAVQVYLNEQVFKLTELTQQSQIISSASARQAAPDADPGQAQQDQRQAALAKLVQSLQLHHRVEFLPLTFL